MIDERATTLAKRGLALALILVLIPATVVCKSDSRPLSTREQPSTARSAVVIETIPLPVTSEPATATHIPSPVPALPITPVGSGPGTVLRRSSPESSTLPTVMSENSGPSAASAVAVSPNGVLVAAVNPDSDSITLVDATTLEVLAEVPVGDDPRTLAISPNSLMALVANHRSDTISLVDLRQFYEVAQYRTGAMPYGVVTDGERAFVTEFGLGKVSVIGLATGRIEIDIGVNPFPAGLALSADGQRLLVTHLFTADVTVIDLQTSTVRNVISTGRDTNLSQFIAISPDGSKAYIPQTRSNATNPALLFDTTVFPVVNVVDLAESRLMVRRRINPDTADEPVNMPFAVVLAPDSSILYLANAGSDDVSVIDLNTNRGLAHIAVGSNPRGVTITPDGSQVFVNNVLDGTLSVIDTDALAVTNTVTLTEIPLAEVLLQGKKIFNSAAEPVLTTDSWISCATCHFDGMMDGRTWQGFPDGPRNTPALFGVGETLPIHWSGDFNELEDVELTIRNIQFGTGLVSGEAHDSLGPPHAGMSPELDALAAYMDSIEALVSPYVDNHERVMSGEKQFNALGCQSCHTPPLFTDRHLHDVGTGDLRKEKNAHGRGTSFDTPSLRALWLTAPYFHDGSALTLEDVLNSGTAHNISAVLTSKEVEDLVAYLQSLP